MVCSCICLIYHIGLVGEALRHTLEDPRYEFTWMIRTKLWADGMSSTIASIPIQAEVHIMWFEHMSTSHHFLEVGLACNHSALKTRGCRFFDSHLISFTASKLGRHDWLMSSAKHRDYKHRCLA